MGLDVGQRNAARTVFPSRRGHHNVNIERRISVHRSMLPLEVAADAALLELPAESTYPCVAKGLSDEGLLQFNLGAKYSV